MNFKNSDGFTLIEVLLALSIMVMVLTPILISQNTIMSSISSFSTRLARIMRAKNFLVQAHRNALEDKKTGQETIQDPVTTLIYKQDKASGAIANKFKDIYRETVQIEWTDDNNKRQDVLVSFVFKPEKNTEQK